MKGDIKKFREFDQQMDWEGGIEGIIRHGFEGTGFDTLDSLLDQVDSLIQEIDNEMSNIYIKYKTELDALEDEEDFKE